MNVVLKLIQLIALAAVGFYTYLTIALYALSPKYYGETALENVGPETLKLVVFGGGAWACVLAALIGIGSLFFQGQKRMWFLFAPLYIPLLYMIGSLTYVLS